MPRNPIPPEMDPRALQMYILDDTVPLARKCEYLATARASSPSHSAYVDSSLVRMIQAQRKRVKQVNDIHAMLEERFQELDEAYRGLTAPPFYPATFLETQTVAGAPAALVHCNDSVRIVRIIDDFDAGSLRAGEHVLLSDDQNLIVDRLASTALDCGETATFERFTPDGRVVISRRDEEVIVFAGGGLEGAGLERGDAVRWSPSAWLAYEKIDRATGDHYFFEEAVSETFDDVGGLDEQIQTLKDLVLLHIVHADITRRYGLPPERSALLVGPPGTGKTMLVKALVSFLRELNAAGRARFINIKPGQLGSMWYSMTEAAIREVFAAARRAAEKDPEIPVVIFFDEIDALASARGMSVSHVDDRAVTALAVELDGLSTRGNILVIAATNRQDTLDPALTRPGRFGDVAIEVNRPDRSAARSILTKYFREDAPFANGSGNGGNGAGAGAAASGGAGAAAGANVADAAAAAAVASRVRDEIIDSTVSRLYSPNGEGDVATLMFRDGARRVIKLHELLNGAVLSKIAREATRRACLRFIHTGEAGITLADVFAAIDDETDRVARILTPANCARYLVDLPQDASVVGVEPIKRKPARVHRFVQMG